MVRFSEKRTKRLRDKLGLPDIDHVIRGNGDHKIYVRMKSGEQYELIGDKLKYFGMWRYYTILQASPPVSQ